MWNATQDGIGTSPVWEPDTGIPELLFGRLAVLIEIYVEFGGVEESSPVGEYGSVLEAAGIGLTPVAGDVSEGGTGSVAME
jgi:hypothetical protein